MARTVEAIKKQMTDVFIGNSYIKDKYGLDAAKTFEEQFSVVSIESIIFQVLAMGIYFLEQLLGTHKAEVADSLSKQLPHSRNWYREKVMRFQYGIELVRDADYYANDGLSTDEITALETVKFCAIEEVAGNIKVKVAKGDAGAREQLTGAEELALIEYLDEIKDAGVNIQVVNVQADKIFAEIDIYYNPLLLDPAAGIVEASFTEYVSTLEFNGVITINALVDNLQKLTGVKLVNPLEIKIQRAANPLEDIGVQKIASSGYWVVNAPEDLVINYKPYKIENI